MTGHFGERIKYWAQIFLLPVYGFSFLMPRNKKIWLFGSTFGRRFTENPRYFYLYVKQNCPEIRAIWISYNKEIVALLQENDCEAYYYHSVKGIFYALRAGVYIFDNYSKDINFWQSGGALKINLWHGSGNKRINYDNKFDAVRHPKNKREKWKTWLRRLSDEKPSHYTLATSAEMAEIFASAFRADLCHIIVEGYPRNDVLFGETESSITNLLSRQEKELLNQIETWKKEGNRILVYMPTFRQSESQFMDVMKLEAFNLFLQEKHLIFLAKLHPKSRVKDAFREIQYSNIVNVDSNIDTYSFLQETDMLVTDYSSVYTDYMLLDRPVVAFQYDREEYFANTREGYFDHDVYMPEMKAMTMTELEDAILSVLKHDVNKEKRQISRNKMFSTIDGKSSERLYIKIKQIIG